MERRGRRGSEAFRGQIRAGGALENVLRAWSSFFFLRVVVAICDACNAWAGKYDPPFS